MKVTASLSDPYLFTLSAKDSPYISEGFKNRTVATSKGFTLSVYSELPGYYIKGQSYKVGQRSTLPAQKTIQATNQVEALYSHGLVIDVEWNDAVTISEVLAGKPSQKIQADGKMFSANHVPQMFSLIPGTGLLITSVNGDFNWKDGMFYGFLTGSEVPYGSSI